MRQLRGISFPVKILLAIQQVRVNRGGLEVGGQFSSFKVPLAGRNDNSRKLPNSILTRLEVTFWLYEQCAWD